MANPELLSNLEYIRSVQIPSTPDNAKYTEVPLPASVEGLRILDIGSGLSVLDMDLAKQGAQVVMLDRKYNDLINLRYDAEDAIRESAKTYAKMVSREDVRKGRAEMERNVTIFFNRLKNERQNMVAGMAGSLPFVSDTFDFVYSQNLITPGLLYFVDVAEHAIDEAVRVTKPGGRVIITPIQVQSPTAEEYMKVMGLELLGRVKRNYESAQLDHSVRAAELRGNSALQIIKPS